MSDYYKKSSLFILFQFTSIPISLTLSAINYIFIFEKNIAVINLLPSFMVSYFFADIMSGFIHWAGDNLGDEKTPFFGNSIVKPFRLHHENPRLMCRISIWENIGTSFFLIIPPQIFLHYVMIKAPHFNLSPEAFFTIQNFFIFTALTNLFHRWAHMPPDELNLLIRTLQNYGLILNPKDHRKHHQGEFDQGYCVTNGWANMILDKTNFWHILTMLVRNFRKR